MDDKPAETSLTPYRALGKRVWKGDRFVTECEFGYEARFLAVAMNGAYGAGHKAGVDETLAAMDRGMARLNEAPAT